MTATRLDSSTLRAFSVLLDKRKSDFTRQGDLTGSSLVALVQIEALKLAAEAEVREPDLADWIAAATRSELGPVVALAHARDGSTLLEWPVPHSGLDTIMARIDANGAVLLGQSHHTPAALREALDAIAAAEKDAAQRQRSLL